MLVVQSAWAGQIIGIRNSRLQIAWNNRQVGSAFPHELFPVDSDDEASDSDSDRCGVCSCIGFELPVQCFVFSVFVFLATALTWLVFAVTARMKRVTTKPLPVARPPQQTRTMLGTKTTRTRGTVTKRWTLLASKLRCAFG